MTKYKTVLPKENTEYTFLQPDGRTFNAYVLINKLDNGRFLFAGRTVTGKYKTANWLTTMTATRFSYLYAKCRTRLYPDKSLSEAEMQTSFDEYLRDIERQKAEEKRRQNLIRMREEADIKAKEEEENRYKQLSATLFNLDKDKKRLLLKSFKIDVEELSEAIQNKATQKYPNSFEGAMQMVADIKTINKVFGLNLKYGC
ncbi:MAG: hypothetical protein IJR66_02345 [Clostridia bacterium]|nr:hypothetical protein [Clostridia bacterium]MBQ9513808.1 hypothetical protein [Clostridia bacterium]